jgi:hypothetical protein
LAKAVVGKASYDDGKRKLTTAIYDYESALLDLVVNMLAGINVLEAANGS